MLSIVKKIAVCLFVTSVGSTANADDLQDLKKIVAIQQAQIAVQTKSLQELSKQLTELKAKQATDVTANQEALDRKASEIQGTINAVAGSTSSVASRIDRLQSGTDSFSGLRIGNALLSKPNSIFIIDSTDGTFHFSPGGICFYPKNNGGNQQCF